MSRTRNRFAIATLAGTGLAAAALALSPMASADPATPVVPGVPAVPGLDMVQQVATDVLAPQAVQQPAPLASAALNYPQAAAVSAPEPAAIPSADISIPQLPSDLMPIPLPSEVSLPGDLLSLLPAATNSVTAPLATAPAVTAPIASTPALPFFPTAGLP